jgi:hypothetical protein
LSEILTIASSFPIKFPYIIVAAQNIHYERCGHYIRIAAREKTKEGNIMGANRAAVCYLHPPRQGLRYGLCRRVIKSLQTLFAIFKLSWRCENFQKELSFSCLQKGRQRGKKDRQDDFKHCHK